MHLIFERSNGRFKSNCNILALAWMPYYDEAKFRQAHFDYHQKLLAQWTGPLGRTQSRALALAGQPAVDAAGNNPHGIQELLRHQGSGSTTRAGGAIDNSRIRRRRQEPAEVDALPPSLILQAQSNRNQNNESDTLNDQLEQLVQRRKLSNSRLYEQFQRYAYIKCDRPMVPRLSRNSTRAAFCNSAEQESLQQESAKSTLLNDELGERYGRDADFGWLAIGNIGKIVGVSLTSIVLPPKELDGRKEKSSTGNQKRDETRDLIVLDVQEDQPNNQEHDNQATNSTTPSKERLPISAHSRPDKRNARQNYNLRGHLDEIILVKWNELYQKLATVDSKGNVLIWCKSNDKFTIQTPFYNRTKSVADFKWSNDGKTALICYTDSFILVGGSSGQRHWHSMLNLEDYHITCASWAPNDEQLLLGVSNGNVVQIDLPQSELTELVVGQANIRTMCWSSCELNLGHLDSAGGARESAPLEVVDHTEDNLPTPETKAMRDRTGDEQQAVKNSTVVNRRRLSRNCALFCRYRPSLPPGASQAASSQDLSSSASPRRPECPMEEHLQSPFHDSNSNSNSNNSNNKNNKPDSCSDILAIDFADSTIKLFDGGLDDPRPREIQVQLESYMMAWSSDGKLLAVGGFNIYTSAPSVGYLRCKYLNSLKFYSQSGHLVYEYKMNFTRYPITALTWAHDDRRLFVATGPRLHCAKVFMGVPQLSLLAMSCLHGSTKQMDKADVLKNLIRKQLVDRVLNWQSFNCPIDLTQQSMADDQNDNQRQLAAISGDSAAGSSTDRSGGAGPGRISLMQLSTSRHKKESATEGSGNEDLNQTDSDQHQQHQKATLVNNINISNYRLPAKLKVKIDQLFMQTLKQPYDEQVSLNDVAWHVPKNQQRHYCTLICYTHELPDVGCLGHQYKAQELAEQQLQQQRRVSSGSSGAISDGGQIVASNQYKLFILYIESQGSLIPILKARRIGFLRPEFVIFDPEENPTKYFQRHHKVSDVSRDGMSQKAQERSAPSGGPDNEQHAHHCLFKTNILNSGQCHELHQSGAPMSSIRRQSSSIESKQDSASTSTSTSISTSTSTSTSTSASTSTSTSASTSTSTSTSNDLCQQTLAHALRQHLKLPQDDFGKSSTKTRTYTPHEIIMDPHLIKLLKRGQIRMQTGGAGQQKRTGTGSSKTKLSSTFSDPYRALEHQQLVSRATSQATRAKQSSFGLTGGVKSLPESSEMVRIKSNIWGTKFKLLNVSNRMIGVRALLGTVSYKASLLHLQPRQIYLNLKDMSNYCVLCSMHHHTKMEPRRRRRRRETGQHMMAADCKLESDSKPAASLIDMPVCSHSNFKTPLKSSSWRQSRHRQSSGAASNQGQQSQSLSARQTDRVILAVGDNIRVAPKLEPNQKYKLAVGSGAASLKTRHSILSPARSPGQSTRRKSSRRGRRPEDNSTHNKAQQCPLASISQAALTKNEDDILTLSLDQGDQVRVEMSSLSSLNATDSLQHNSRTRSIKNRDDELQSLDDRHQKVDEFLQANKTLKSIQTITKMIVDLSSKAQDETMSSCFDLNQQEASPLKLLKTGLNSSSPSASPMARQYIPPDTPVHRPRRLASSIGQSSTADRAQSVSNTQLRMASFRESSKSQQRRGSTKLQTSDKGGPSLHPEAPLPPAPPSVPFRRKLSTSAKRFFDGSLRSLTSLGGAGGYLSTSEDLDSEDCEALVERRLARSRPFASSGRSRRAQANSKLPNFHHCQSQPCTPLKSLRSDFSSSRKQSTIDLAQLRSQVVEKLRQSTSWMSASSGSFALPTRDNRADSKRRSHKFEQNSQSCTKQTHWVHKSGFNHTHSGYTEGSVALSSSSSSSSSSASSLDPSDESSFSSSFSSSDDHDEEEEEEAETHATDKMEAFGFLDEALRAKLFKKISSRHSASAKDLNDLVRMSLVEDARRHHGRLTRNPDSRGRSGVTTKQSTPSKTEPKRRHRRRRTRKSICRNSNCCCSREFKLNNRPPVWNEQSQVYQLDFGGRVTQESAKNLQIDFNGNLALQFGRIDKCTYTLDYKYPFNAVQAMSIALASLTQRLK